MRNLVGQQFGNYHLISLLGQGNFADVYLAQHTYLKTQVAVKVLQLRLLESSLEGFLDEARTIASLHHPHIVNVQDFGVQNDSPYLVMTYAPNGSMRQRYPPGTVLPLYQIDSYIKQIAGALQYAHDRKIIHRDINPANLLLDSNGDVLLGDFGIAVLAHRTYSWVEQNVAGTAAYMAPEQFHAKAVPASDQYSLGIVAYEWLSGTPPFTGNFLQLSYQHNFVVPPLLHEKTTISPTVEKVVLKAMAKKIEDRFESVQDFAKALEEAVEPQLIYSTRLMTAHPPIQDRSPVTMDEHELHVTAPFTPSKPIVTRPVLSRRLVLISFFLIGFLLVSVVGGFLWLLAFHGALFGINKTSPTILITVTTLIDNIPGSLRQAIAEAQSGDTITFASNIRGTVVLTVDDLVISKNLAIRGPGAGNLSISFGKVDDRIYISYGSTVSISGLSFKGSELISSSVLTNSGTLTLTNVIVSNNSSQRASGGIDNKGTLIINSSIISGNTSSCCGGGIDSVGTVTIDNSTISGNSTSLGGGGIATNGQLTLISSTISGNTALGGGGIYNTGTFTMINSTIADNTAKEGGGAFTTVGGKANITFCTIYGNHAHDIGGIVIKMNSLVTMGGSIVAGNISNTGPNIMGNLITGGYNLIQSSSVLQFVDPYNKHSTDIEVNASAGLGIDSHLQNNGGATETLQLLPGSPAIDHIPPNDCNLNSTDSISTDQRGTKRPQGPGCDIGAYEYASIK